MGGEGAGAQVMRVGGGGLNELFDACCSGVGGSLSLVPMFSFFASGLQVGAGSWRDPAAVQGCAHFLEHMLFMGSERWVQG